MNRHQRQLSKELQAAGATGAEMAELLPLADQLQELRPKLGWRMRLNALLRPALLSASGLAAGMALVIFSQAALPTSWLYPVQALSDSVAMAAHPEYRATVMMRRAEQVRDLVASKAAQPKIMATLADYSKQAADYRTSTHASYAAFEYCKSNLQHAAAQATPQVRAAIQSSLQSLQNV